MLRDSPPCGRYLPTVLIESKEGSGELTILLVKPIPTRFQTNILYTPVDSIPCRVVEQESRRGSSSVLRIVSRSANQFLIQSQLFGSCFESQVHQATYMTIMCNDKK